MSSRLRHRFVKIKSLGLYISLVKNYARFTIESNLGRFSGIVEDPVDFVAEMARLTNEYRFGIQSFKGAAVVVTTEAVSVNRGYLTKMEKLKNWSFCSTDEICIYSGPYALMLKDDGIHLPVGQHSRSFFDLYLNALRYFYTEAQIPAEK